MMYFTPIPKRRIEPAAAVYFKAFGENSNVRVIQWLIGYTHPYLELELVYHKIEEETSEIKKAELMKELTGYNLALNPNGT